MISLIFDPTEVDISQKAADSRLAVYGESPQVFDVTGQSCWNWNKDTKSICNDRRIRSFWNDHDDLTPENKVVANN